MEQSQKTLVPPTQPECFVCGAPTTGEGLTCVCTRCGRRQYDLCHCGAIIGRQFSHCPVCGAKRVRISKKERVHSASRLQRLALLAVLGLFAGLLFANLGVYAVKHFTAKPAAGQAATAPGVYVPPKYSFANFVKTLKRGAVKLARFAKAQWPSLVGGLIGVAIALYLGLKPASRRSSGSGNSRRVKKKRRNSNAAGTLGETSSSAKPDPPPDA